MDVVLATVKTDAQRYACAALMEIKDVKSVLVLLNKEKLEMKWDNPEEFKTLTFQKLPENNAFAKGLALHQEPETKRVGLLFLLTCYAQDEIKGAFVTQEIELHMQVVAVSFGFTA